MLRFLNEFSDNPPALFAYLAAFCVAFITGIAFHEFSHAWTANELGDDTAKRLGRVSLNPIRHLDPLGTVLLLLIGFGWGKPTPVNPYRLRNGVKRGNLIVAAVTTLVINSGLPPGAAAIGEGMETMYENGLKQAVGGVTTIEEVLRVTRED